MSATNDPDARATHTHTPPIAASCNKSARIRVLAATILASAMAFIDGSIVQVALPSIQKTLNTTFSELQWVVNGYMLMLGALLLAGGALGDQAGRKRVFSAGITLFALSSLACALAPSISSLIAGRVAQGLGAALMVPQSLAIIAATFPREVRGRAIGTWAAASALTTATGPVLGGVLIDLASWRAAFWINLPLAVIALWLTCRHVTENHSDKHEPVDWPGAGLATLALGALTYALTRFPNITSGLPTDVLTAGLLAGIAAVGFLRHEFRNRAPLVPPELFRHPEFAGLNAMTLLLYSALSGTLFLVPYNLIQLRGYSATEAGLALLPLGLLLGILSRYTGRLCDRFGTRTPLIIGPLLVASGCAGLAVPGAGGSYLATFFTPITTIALGMATTVSPLTTAVMNAAPDERSGAASGINNAASRIAGLLAVALSGALASAVFAAVLDNELSHLPITAGLHARVMAGAGRLAELNVPDGLTASLHSQINGAIDAAFVSAFRASTLMNAAFATAAAGIAALLLRRRSQ